MAKRMMLGVLLLATSGLAGAEVTAIRNVRLFDGQKVIPNAVVVFSDGVVVAAGASVEVPEGAAAIDGSGKTLFPGLIDSHTHVFADSLHRALRFGVAMELDMFTSADVVTSMKKPADDRAGLLSAGTLVTVAGGHGSQYFPIPTFTPGSDAQTFVDARLAEGSDYIKLILEDGEALGRKIDTLSKADVRALIAAAHKRGRKAVVHITTLPNARAAIEAGADGLVHIFGATPPDAGFGEFAAKHGVFVVPTLTVVESVYGTPSGASLVTDSRLQPFLNGAEIEGLKQSFPPRPGTSGGLNHAFAAVRQLHDAGVRILAGTDAPNAGTAHGASMHRELELLVKAGLKPAEALAAATSVPASAFGLKDRGRIATGMRADLVLVNGDPTTDIFATRDIVAIWKNGVPLSRRPETREAQAAVEIIPAEALAAGLIADFENGKPEARFGMGWQVSTDSITGGKSTAAMSVVDGGAGGSAHSLRIDTDTKPGAMFPWAGGMVFFGSRPMAPVDLSSKSGLTFLARGNTDVRLMAFSKSTGRIPRLKTVRAGADWTSISVDWSDFGSDGKDMQAILFAGPEEGMAWFQIDELRLK